MPGVRRAGWLLVLCFLAGPGALFAQQECPLPATVKPVPPEKNIFSDQQEADLSDIMAESTLHEYVVISDESLTAHLRQLGEKLTQYLPPNHFRFRFLLIEFPEANAFSLPGGLVYVSRKMVALARSDDELAGVIAHELGHIVTHQGAIRTTLIFRQVIGVTQVGDRADIAAKYHEMLDTWNRHPPKVPDREEEDQLVADQIALYAMARAGFDPQAWIDLLDRLQQTRGKTGGFWSDFFGATKPEERRLRASLRSMAAMPPACTERVSPASAEQYGRWQKEVIAYDINARTESLSGVLLKQRLALPLRPDITNLRFSPDGRYVLAQDSGGIQVLSREPFAPIFFIDAIDAYKATFSPDSRSVVFYTPHLRVEVWDLATQKRTGVHEVILHDPCLQSALSPDGNFLACFTPELTLSVFDVSTSQPLATKKNFLTPSFQDIIALFAVAIFGADANVQLANFGFSPDGRYFLAGTHSDTFAFDLEVRKEASLPGSVRNLTQGSFAFVGHDRIVGINFQSPKKSPVLRFPSGERVQQVALGTEVRLAFASHGDYVVVGPLKDKPLGILNLRNDDLISLSHDAGDMYDGILLYELNDGSVALADTGTQKNIASVQLKQARLGGIRAVAVSDDFTWLAVSTHSRGAVWDLTHNIRSAYVRGFTGAWFGPDRALYADFPKKDQQEREIARLDSLGGVNAVYQIKEMEGNQAGPYFAVRRSGEDEKPKKKGWILDLRDFRTRQTVWSRVFPRGFPAFTWNTAAGTLLMGHPVYSDFVQDEIKQFSDLKKKADSNDYFLEEVDLKKDAVTGKLLINTNKGSFRVDDFAEDGDWIAIETSNDRVITYKLSSGEELGHVFGTDPVISGTSRLLAVSTSTGEVNVSRLEGGKVERQFKFPASVAYKRFSADGKRLFVLTRDQTAYVLDVNGPVTSAAEK